jgi:hypothetical protein
MGVDSEEVMVDVLRGLSSVQWLLSGGRGPSNVTAAAGDRRAPAEDVAPGRERAARRTGTRASVASSKS